MELLCREPLERRSNSIGLYGRCFCGASVDGGKLMVPDRSFKTGERITGNWWLASRHTLLGFFRVRVILEIEERWERAIPPRPGSVPPPADWRRSSRPATPCEVQMLQYAHPQEFNYAPFIGERASA